MKDDIIRMAREAGMLTWLNPPEDVTERFERFAALVAARCADIAYEAEPFHSADLIREAFGVEK
jgi:uncharacterized membrane protein YccC